MRAASRSFTCLASTTMRISRPACTAKACSTPGKPQARASSSSRRLTYFSSVSRRAPGRAAEMASAAATRTVDVVDPNIVVVPQCGVHDFGAFTVALEQFGPDGRVAPFHFMIGRFADVVQKAAAAGEVAIEAQLLGEHSREKG